MDPTVPGSGRPGAVPGMPGRYPAPSGGSPEASGRPPNALCASSVKQIAQLQALVAKNKPGQTIDNRPKCQQCGIAGHDAATCHAKMLADGMTPPNWDKKDEDVKQRVQKRADEIKQKESEVTPA